MCHLGGESVYWITVFPSEGGRPVRQTCGTRESVAAAEVQLGPDRNGLHKQSGPVSVFTHQLRG